jgi:hypothetical protein
LKSFDQGLVDIIGCMALCERSFARLFPDREPCQRAGPALDSTPGVEDFARFAFGHEAVATTGVRVNRSKRHQHQLIQPAAFPRLSGGIRHLSYSCCSSS